jgi:peptide-methionine (S)-S-oxide reductase
MRRRIHTAFILAALMAFNAAPALASSKPVTIAPPAQDMSAQDGSTKGPQTIVLAGGCFWGVQAVFQHTRGVTRAVSGYAGGTRDTANYKIVSAGSSQHAEAVAVTFDPAIVSAGKIMQIFFSVVHDPTQLNRQGPDVGPQYRSEIFPANEEQRALAVRYIAQLDAAKSFARPIATKVAAAGAAFYEAEAYHQDYATLHPMQPYIVINDAPKVRHLKAMFGDVFREQPVLIGAKVGVN